ncbi:carboxylesterase 1-like [Melia azedarach]|uniref:Carboxylesterase 1-like n=2 Tax=Melia azedarach TaxID=155640 RepID=A0ACC1Y2Y9_MELAZ|nr:carboxylesterase 1-like [Melia azedarach]KAJ4717299.1 carboxylesterase 1-like [Melia azedarach]
MADETVSSPSAIDPYKFLQIVPNPDGTVTRIPRPTTVAIQDPNHDRALLVLSKDVPVNQLNNTWVRIFLPRQALDSSFSTKLPLILHFHGGGLVILSAATTIFHDFCSNIAAEIPCIIASVEYRLAPEHRLPAAYDDAMEALHWMKTTQEEWLQKYADFSCCFIMGDSAGGNIAYHTGLRAAAQVDNLLPLKIKGLILNYPYFGGVKRTESELKMVNDPFSPLCVSDLQWELALPPGTDRDHEYCNPTVGGGSKLLDQIKLLGWKVLMTAGKADILIDHQIEVLKMMEQKGMQVVSHFNEGGHDAFKLPADYKALRGAIASFILSNSASAGLESE